MDRSGSWRRCQVVGEREYHETHRPMFFTIELGFTPAAVTEIPSGVSIVFIGQSEGQARRSILVTGREHAVVWISQQGWRIAGTLMSWSRRRSTDRPISLAGQNLQRTRPMSKARSSSTRRSPGRPAVVCVSSGTSVPACCAKLSRGISPPLRQTRARIRYLTRPRPAPLPSLIGFDPLPTSRYCYY